MQIAVDAMGGDFAPRSAVEGAVQAAGDGARVILVGDRTRIAAELERLGDPAGRVTVVHADEVVAMEERAVTVLQKPEASIMVCARLVKEGRAQAVVSVGNTGAAMIAAKTVIGTIPGVDRPALAAGFPRQQRRTPAPDAGAIAGARPAHLRQFAVMGHFYAQGRCATGSRQTGSRQTGSRQTASPRLGLMSIGAEEGKGTRRSREAFKVLQRTGLNFIGNVEGRDVFSGAVDVIVCDGFVGNVMLKSLESLADTIGALIRVEAGRTWRSRLGYWLARPALGRFHQRTHWSEYGAVPLLGVQGGFFIGHGHSKATAIRSAVHRAVEFCEAELDVKIREKVAELHAQEARILGEAGAQG